MTRTTAPFLVLFTAFAAPTAAQPLAPLRPDSVQTDALAWARRAAEARRAARETKITWDDEARAEALVASWAATEAGLSAVLARADRERLATAHLFVPDAAEALVEQQKAVVERRFRGVQRRGRRYFPMIERALARRGLPADLKYVALIESALDPAATSGAGAAGLWQFMPATAAGFGLDSSGVRDPARSTAAAVRYLAQLHRQFGDWQIALAAYNCGPGRVARLVRAHRTRTGKAPTFWDLHASLPAETRDYVPRFIAAAEHFGAS